MLTFSYRSLLPIFSVSNLKVNTQQPLSHIIINTNVGQCAQKHTICSTCLVAMLSTHAAAVLIAPVVVYVVQQNTF